LDVKPLFKLSINGGYLARFNSTKSVFILDNVYFFILPKICFYQTGQIKLK